MGNNVGIGNSRVIMDVDGEAATVTNNRLDVNATIQAGDLNVGNVDIHLNGGVPLLGGDGDVAAGVLRVTIADNDNVSTKLTTIATNTGTLDNIVGVQDASTGTSGARVMGVSRLIDGNALPIVSAEGDNTLLNCSLYGVQFTNLVTESGTDSAVVRDNDSQVVTPAVVNVGGEYRSGLTTYSDGDVTILQTNVNGALMIAALPAGLNNIGTIGHNITGMVSEVNGDIGTSAEDLRPAGDTACKRVDMMANPANTGYIWVGDSSVVNDGTGGGIRLSAGDFYSVDVNSVNDIHVAATVNGELIMYTYFT